MNEAKKLTLSKETLRCLDDDDLTDVVGGWGGYSHDCNNSHACQGSGVCISAGCDISGGCSGGCSHALVCF